MWHFTVKAFIRNHGGFFFSFCFKIFNQSTSIMYLCNNYVPVSSYTHANDSPLHLDCIFYIWCTTAPLWKTVKRDVVQGLILLLNLVCQNPAEYCLIW